MTRNIVTVFLKNCFNHLFFIDMSIWLNLQDD